MDFIIDAIVEWLKGLLVDGIMGNLDGLFDNVNQSVGEIATQVGTTPADWNAGVFSMIRQISETAILPIAGVILTFVMTYELIQMLIERNNLHEVDTWMFFKWVFKTFVAVMILTNTFNIVLAVFDVSQHVIQQSAGIIQNGTEITPDVLDSLRTELEAMELGPLFGLWLQSFLIQLTMIALNIVIFVIVAGRIIARPFAWHGFRLLSASGQHGPRSTLRATAGLFLRGPFRLCLFGSRFSGFELVADGCTPHRATLRHLFQLCLIGLQNSGVELFPELLCDRVGHIPVAAFAVWLAGHPKKEPLAALYDFQIFHHKAVIEFHAGKAHEVFHRFDDPHAYIQLYRGGWCSARCFFLHGFLLSASGRHSPKSLNGSRRWILQDCLF